MADTTSKNCVNDNLVSTYRHFYDKKETIHGSIWGKTQKEAMFSFGSTYLAQHSNKTGF
jgi:hypothetical protein